MKKALALIMAIAMIASMAAVSFAAATNLTGSDKSVDAAVGFNTTIATYDSTAKQWYGQNNEVVPFGTTVYVVLVDDNGVGVDDAAAVANVKVDAKWTKNGSYIKGAEIVKVGGLYAVAITTTGSSLEHVIAEGELQLAGKSYNKDGDGKTTSTVSLKGVKTAISIEFGYDLVTPAATETGIALNDGDKKVYNFKNIDDEDFAVDFGGKVLVETYMKNTKKVLVAYNEDASEEILDAYVDANLDFYNVTASFRRTATVTIPAAEGSYLYEVVDGALVPVDAEYDEWAEEFTFKTRTMGSYVVSDMELVAEEVVVANPSTGAAA